VDERDVIVAHDDVAQGAQPLLDTLEGDFGREGVSEMLQFLVGRRAGYEETVTVPGGQSADDAGTGDGGVDDGDDVLELGLEDRVKVGG